MRVRVHVNIGPLVDLEELDFMVSKAREVGFPRLAIEFDVNPERAANVPPHLADGWALRDAVAELEIEFQSRGITSAIEVDPDFDPLETGYKTAD